MFTHPHARSPRPYVVTLQAKSLGEPMLPGEVFEFALADGALTFRVWYPEETP